MSDGELEAIKRRKLRELQRQLAAKQKQNIEDVSADTRARKVLDSVFKGRAWEVFTVASYQFPKIMGRVKDALVQSALSGRLKEVTGEQLYVFLRSMGLRVRLDTKIRYTEHGKLKSLAEKIKEDLQKT